MLYKSKISFPLKLSNDLKIDYYILEPAAATKQTESEFPQIQYMSPAYNYSEENSSHSLRVDRFSKAAPNLDYFILHNRARFTDLLSEAVTGGGGLLVSPKLKSILEQFNLIPHHFYPAKVKHKDSFYPYFWIHLVGDLTEYLDYPNSRFVIKGNFGK